MPYLSRLFSEFPISQVRTWDGVRIPTLRLDEALPYASLRPIDREGCEQVRLPQGIAMMEIPFDGDIGVFDLIPEDGIIGPPGETRGHYVRLYVPLGEDGQPSKAAMRHSLARVLGVLRGSRSSALANFVG